MNKMVQVGWGTETSDRRSDVATLTCLSYLPKVVWNQGDCGEEGRAREGGIRGKEWLLQTLIVQPPILRLQSRNTLYRLHSTNLTLSTGRLRSEDGSKVRRRKVKRQTELGQRRGRRTSAAPMFDRRDGEDGRTRTLIFVSVLSVGRSVCRSVAVVVLCPSHFSSFLPSFPSSPFLS